MSRWRMRTAAVLAWCGAIASSAAGQAIDIGDRRELFVDDHVIAETRGVEWRLHEPVDRGTVLAPGDMPSESRSMGYPTVIHDGETYRMYYRGSGGLTTGTYCYAESNDGVTWTKPILGLHEFKGSRENNIILMGDGGHSFSPFLDTNPNAKPDERFKGTGLRRTADNKRWQLLAFASADGKSWRLIRDEPMEIDGAFDSQNVAFWSELEGKYVMYFRTKSGGHTGLRQISKATSDDFLRWTAGTKMEYHRFGEPVEEEQMYTNQTSPYFRAPHLYVATSARFMQGRRAVSEAEEAEFGKGNFKDCSDAVLMTTRGDHRYARTFMEGWVRPKIGTENWGSRSNYPSLGVVPTGENEMSVYVVEAYGLPGVRMQRYSLRTDGFASLRAPHDGGTVTTKPLRCPGGTLTLNYATSAAGFVRVTVLDERGQPIRGLSGDDVVELIGNEIDGKVAWKSAEKLDDLTGRVIRLRFEMKDADLYAMRFGD